MEPGYAGESPLDSAVWLGSRLLRVGLLIDRIGPRFRALMPVCLVLSLPLAWMHSLPNGGLVLGEMFLAMFALAGFVVLAVAYATRAFSSDHAGLLAGIGAGSWGAVIALTSPYFGRLFDRAEYAATLFPIAGYVLWLTFSSRVPAAE
jgi:ACS family hexuronate transporter-like MFS transporter